MGHPLEVRNTNSMNTDTLATAIKWHLDHATDDAKGKVLHVLGPVEGRLAELMQDGKLTIIVESGLIPNVAECASWSPEKCGMVGGSPVGVCSLGYGHSGKHSWE